MEATDLPLIGQNTGTREAPFCHRDPGHPRHPSPGFTKRGRSMVLVSGSGAGDRVVTTGNHTRTCPQDSHHQSEQSLVRARLDLERLEALGSQIGRQIPHQIQPPPAVQGSRTSSETLSTCRQPRRPSRRRNSAGSPSSDAAGGGQRFGDSQPASG
ncbi:hypothetical protein ASPZODRAFT_189849 [Penicilliopsis zonata CBS 506.65]|uniref:Uncharacterized protein n=1 Tax=Penicilliopsis zonata CBS 506.65 TaxID=1073090 RepID=A0A1L9STT9_9EURO|nr:hypothetical protein ASPZODRAFT_189849 [Penicilliopsis zonata CBS 506.65]OJJ50493.1 hypothetical protein ASPZODRAFT_189849 [Penicilliopsis zonata CBS 506.65]